MNGRGFVTPVKEIQAVLWDVMQNFDHALLLQEGDPLMPAILGVYEKQGIKDGHSDKIQRGRAFKCDLGYRTGKPPGGYQGYFHLQNMVALFYCLLKDKLNIKNLRFQSNARNLIAASAAY